MHKAEEYYVHVRQDVSTGLSLSLEKQDLGCI